MYQFATLAMLGLALWKTVGMLLGLTGRDLDASVKALVTMVLGIVIAQGAGYSAFAGWGVTFRNDTWDTALTGLTIGAFAYVWHYVLGYLEGHGRLSRDQAREIEHRAPKAA